MSSNARRALDRADWRALRDLPRSRVPEALRARAKLRGITPKQLVRRLKRIHRQEAGLLPLAPSRDMVAARAAAAEVVAARRASVVASTAALLVNHPAGLPLTTVATVLGLDRATVRAALKASPIRMVSAGQGSGSPVRVML